MADYIRDLLPTKWGSGVSLHGSNHEPFMSALEQKQTSRHLQPMSALPPKAHIRNHPALLPLSKSSGSWAIFAAIRRACPKKA